MWALEIQYQSMTRTEMSHPYNIQLLCRLLYMVWRLTIELLFFTLAIQGIIELCQFRYQEERPAFLKALYPLLPTVWRWIAQADFLLRVGTVMFMCTLRREARLFQPFRGLILL